MATSENQLLDEKKLEKMARMAAAEIPQRQIAQACGVSESRISQIFKTPEYKEQEEKVALEEFEQNEIINRGWDGVEALSLKKVVSTLQADADPEFALKAAALANKAIRRGKHHNNPISQKAGVRSVINLNMNFVEKLQNNIEIGNQRTTELLEKKKDSNFLGAKQVQELLQSKDTTQQEDLIPDFKHISSGN